MKLEVLIKNDWKIHTMYVMVTSEAYQNRPGLTLLWNVFFLNNNWYIKNYFLVLKNGKYPTIFSFVK